MTGHGRGQKYRHVIPEVAEAHFAAWESQHNKSKYYKNIPRLCRHEVHLCCHHQLKATVLTKHSPEWVNAWIYLLRVIFSQSMREGVGGRIFTYSALWLMYSPPTPFSSPKNYPPFHYFFATNENKKTTPQFVSPQLILCFWQSLI